MPQAVLEDERADDSNDAEDAPRIAQDDKSDKDGWRIESKGNGRFCLRSGSGRNRIQIAGYYISYEDLKDERKAAYEHNAKRDAEAKARNKAKWG